MAAQAIKREMEKSGEFSMLQRRLDIIEHDFKDMVDILSDWAEGFEIIVGQLKGANITPNWQPEPKDVKKIKEFKKRQIGIVKG